LTLSPLSVKLGQAHPDLIARDEDGKVTTLHYEAINATLLNELLKEFARIRNKERLPRKDICLIEVQHFL
jgi:hypothetical protein